MKHALLLSFGLAFVVTAAPATAHDAPKSWFTPAQRAYIQAQCGVDPDNRHGNLNINGSVLTCPNGRTVDDPQVAAMSQDIKRRTSAYVRQVMADAGVQRGLAIASGEQARRAVAQADIEARVADVVARADIARTVEASIDEAQIERQVQAAMAQAEIGRKTAERVRDALAKSGLDTH